MSMLHIGLLGIAVLFVLLAASMPVGFAMTVVGVVGFAAVVNGSAALNMLVTDYYDTFCNYGLTVIPLFVFMGQVAFHTGISKKLFAAAQCWFGWLRGGLAMATVGACAAFGAICGSGPATAATMAAVALPEMKRYRYHPGFAAGTVAAGGSLGMMIPPSVVFIVYGIMTEQSIGKLFIAGVVPGLMIGVLFMLIIGLLCRVRPALAPAASSVSWAARIRSLSGTVEMILLFALVMGGMFVGWFTPTEAAAVGAAGVLVLTALSRKLSVRMVTMALFETLRTSCMVLVIVAGATVFGHFLQITNVPTELATWMANLPLPGWPQRLVLHCLRHCATHWVRLLLLCYNRYMNENLKRALFIVAFLVIVIGAGYGIYILLFKGDSPIVRPPTSTSTTPGELPIGGPGGPSGTGTTPGGPGTLPVTPGQPFDPS